MYVKELIYKIPLKANAKDSQPERLVLYAAYKNEDDALRTGQYFLSADAVHWEECTPGETTVDTIFLTIPKAWIRRKEIYHKFSPKSEAAFAGMALL